MYLHYRLTGVLSAFFLITVGILICCCSDSHIAGTSVIGNPESVSAVIVDKNGVPQKNVPVALVPADYNPVKLTDSLSIVNGTTDAAGRVVLKLGNDSIYNLTSTNSVYRYELLRKVIISDSVRNSNNETIDLGNVQLKDPGIILITIDSSSYKTGNYVTIPGTLIKMEVETPGLYPLKSPAGLIDVKYCNATTEETIGSVQVNSSGVVELTTSPTDTGIADTTITRDTLLIKDTLNMNDTVIKIDTLHNIDTVKAVDPVIHRDSTTKTDTINKNFQVLHGIKNVEYTDSVVTADTTYSGDSITVITTKKRLTGKDVIDTTKKFDTLWLLNTTRDIFTTGTINDTHYIDSVQTKTVVLKRTIERTTKRIITITTVIVSSVPQNGTSLPDAAVKKDTLINTDIKDIIDSLIIPDTNRIEGFYVDSAIVHGDSIITRDTNFTIDTLKTVKVSYSIDTTSFKDTTLISRDSVKMLMVHPDSSMIPVTYFDLHSDKSNTEFAGNYKSGITLNMVLSVLDNDGKPASTAGNVTLDDSMLNTTMSGYLEQREAPILQLFLL